VHETKPSRTARGVAAERAVLTDLGILDDPHAASMLPPPTARIHRLVGRLPRRLVTRSVTLAGLSARVLWVDAQLSGALDGGTRQVAVVGAGYDSRAWRCARDGVRFLELDHPATQADKVRRAPGPGPTYVAVDVVADDAGEALRDGGLDVGTPTAFLVEGVTMYLDEAEARRLLTSLSAVAAPGSRLVVDFFPPAGTGSASDRRLRRLQRALHTGSGESFRLGVDRAGATSLVEGAGWRVDEVTTLREAAGTLVPNGSGLPVDAIHPGKLLLTARMP
jgi:methyltransferase (TIGR00027 family)